MQHTDCNLYKPNVYCLLACLFQTLNVTPYVPLTAIIQDRRNLHACMGNHVLSSSLSRNDCIERKTGVSRTERESDRCDVSSFALTGFINKTVEELRRSGGQNTTSIYLCVLPTPVFSFVSDFTFIFYWEQLFRVGPSRRGSNLENPALLLKFSVTSNFWW